MNSIHLNFSIETKVFFYLFFRQTVNARKLFVFVKSENFQFFIYILSLLLKNNQNKVDNIMNFRDLI